MDRVQLVSTKDLQEIYQLVNRTSSWDAINWNKYPTVPGQGNNMVKIKNRTGIGKYLVEEQRRGKTTEYDTHIVCDGGFVPCHRIFLMEFSPVLKRLIEENMKEIGIPSHANLISIALKDFKLQNVIDVLLLFYTGLSIFPVTNLRPVISLLEFLQVKHDAVPEIATQAELKRKKDLKRYEDMEDDDEDEDEEEKIEKKDDENNVPPSRTTEWVQGLPGHSTSPPELVTTQDKPQTEIEDKEKVFVKVPPGSLINRKPKPRIQRTKNCGAGMKSPTKKSPKKPEKEPQPSTSKAAIQRDCEAEEHYSEYNPGDGSSSDSEAFSNKGDSEVEEEEQPTKKPNLRRRRIVSKEINGEDDAHSTLGERVKTKSRYPQRTRKETGRRLSVGSADSSHGLVVASEKAKRKKVIERESTEEAKEPAISSPPPKSIKSTMGRYKCYYCKSMFSCESELLVHCDDVCGNHLIGKYNYTERICLNCGKDYPAFSHFGLLRHVQNCFMNYDPSSKHHLVDVDADEYDSCGEEQVDEDAEVIEEDQKIYGDEKFPVGDPCVVVERLSDGRIARIINSVNKGNNVVIPRTIGYNYVKITPKSEMPDHFPDFTPGQIRAQLRIYEREQEEYERMSEKHRKQETARREKEKRLQLEQTQREQEEQQRKEAAKHKREESKRKKEAVREEEESQRKLTAQVVPPLVLNRSRLLSSEQEVLQNAKEIFDKLTVCSCGKELSTLAQATKCLSTHGYKRCWICCQALSVKSPLENHYRTCHNESGLSPGEVACPICKKLLKYNALNKHISGSHLHDLIRNEVPIEAHLTSTTEGDNNTAVNSDVAKVSERRVTGSSSDEDDTLINRSDGSLDNQIHDLKEIIRTFGPDSKSGKKADKRLKKLEKKLGKIPSNNTACTEQEIPCETNKTQDHQVEQVTRKRPVPTCSLQEESKKQRLSEKETDSTIIQMNLCRGYANSINAHLKGKTMNSRSQERQEVQNAHSQRRPQNGIASFQPSSTPLLLNPSSESESIQLAELSSRSSERTIIDCTELSRNCTVQPPPDTMGTSLTIVQPSLDRDCTSTRSIPDQSVESVSENTLLLSTNQSLPISQSVVTATWQYPVERETTTPKTGSNLATLCSSELGPVEAVTVTHTVPTASISSAGEASITPIPQITVPTSSNQRALLTFNPSTDNQSNNVEMSNQANQVALSPTLNDTSLYSQTRALQLNQPRSAVLSSFLQRGLLAKPLEPHFPVLPPNPENNNGREYCGQTMVNGQIFTVYRRTEATRPHPNTVVSLAGGVGRHIPMIMPPNFTNAPNTNTNLPQMRAILPSGQSPISNAVQVQQPTGASGQQSSAAPQTSASSMTLLPYHNGQRRAQPLATPASQPLQDSQQRERVPFFQPDIKPVLRPGPNGEIVAVQVQISSPNSTTINPRTNSTRSSVTVRACPTCSRLFKSEDMYHSHIC